MSVALPLRVRSATALRGLLVGGAVLAAALAITAATTAVAALARRSWSRPPLVALLVVAVLAVLLLPRVRRGAERLAARLSHGERADDYAEMASLVTQVAATVSVDDVLPRLAETAARSVHGEQGEVRLVLSEGRHWRQVWPPEGASVDTAAAVEVQHDGATVGEIAVDAPTGLSSADLRLLDELARPAGLALSTVRLTFELRERAAQLEAGARELRASRARLVEAHQRERERLRAEVERTVAPRLDATRAALGQAREQVGQDPERLAAALASARDSAAAGLEALRRLARGIVPSQLHEIGAAAALEVWLAEEGLPADVQASGEPGALRGEPALEAALFHCCASAAAELCRSAPGRVAVEVVTGPDACSFAVGQPRSGAAAPFDPELAVALTDRVEALGGRLQLEQAAAHVRVSGRLPREAAP